MEFSMELFATKEFALIAASTGVAVETVKRVTEFLAPSFSDTRLSKAVWAVSPIIIGMAIGSAVIGLSADGPVLGAVAGSVAATVYDTVVRPIKGSPNVT